MLVEDEIPRNEGSQAPDRPRSPRVAAFFPVLVESFELRRDSNGQGRCRGGDRARRRIRLRETMTAAILPGNRRVAPVGTAGGAPGMVGGDGVERTDGRILELGGTAEPGSSREMSW